MKNRQIGTFKEYLKEQKQQKLNESNVKIECDFWDACVAEVLKDLEDESCGFIDWNVLGDYIKTKFAILGRTWDEYIDNLYVLEIKDLIWAHHGKSFCNCTNNNAELHSKGVVVEATYPNGLFIMWKIAHTCLIGVTTWKTGLNGIEIDPYSTPTFWPIKEPQGRRVRDKGDLKYR